MRLSVEALAGQVLVPKGDEMAWINKDSSESALWDYLSPFETIEHVRRIYSELHCPSRMPGDKIHQIAAAFGQGRMYFASAKPAPLGVKPVLLYYGASALLTGLALIRAPGLTQQNWHQGHGLSRVHWPDVLYDEAPDLLLLKIQAREKGTFRNIVETIWQGHVETVFYGHERPRETAPYDHRLGAVDFAKDGSSITFADLAARSRYTGGYFATATNRSPSLSRASVWVNPKKGPSGVHVTVPIDEVARADWLVDYARKEELRLLGPSERPYGAIFPRGDVPPLEKPDLLPVFHYEQPGLMSLCQPMPNGDRPSELIKLYLMAYIVGMFARYFPPQWMDVIRGTSAGPDTSVFITAVSAIEQNFVREFAGQLAVLGNDPHFFGEHFGSQAKMVAPDWRTYIGGTGSGTPIFGDVPEP